MKLNRLFLACVVVVLMAFGCSGAPEWPGLKPGSLAMAKPTSVRVPIDTPSGRFGGLDFLDAGDMVRVIDDPAPDSGDFIRKIRVVVESGTLKKFEGTISRNQLAPLP